MNMNCFNMEGWIKDNFEIEPIDRVLRTTQKSRFTVTRTRYWSDRPYFKEGDLVMSSGLSLELYQILGRVGTPKRPHYDVRKLYEGTIEFNQAGYHFQLLTPKKEDYPKFKEVNETKWPEYIPKPREKKKRKIKE